MDTTNVWGLHPLGFSAKIKESNNYIVQYCQFDQWPVQLVHRSAEIPTISFNRE